ncbi:adenylate/guanylate cyclase domain-containing protein, partial [candidate division CSSED10-310 bacterium]
KNQVCDLVEGLSTGANDYIAKPFSKSELLARIKTHLILLNINKAYGRFVPHEFLKTLGRETILDVKLGDQIQGEMSVLFSDIRSFTSLSEKMSPKENFDFLNDYLKSVIPSVRRHGGFIDKYIGDAVMAVFPRSAQDAISSAVDTMNQVKLFNDSRLKRGQSPIAIGIGIHTGVLMLGTIGDEQRMDGTVISDTVNVSSRLEGLTKKYGVSIIVSEDTLNKLTSRHDFNHRFLGKVQVKGKKDVVTIFEIFDGDPVKGKELKLKTKPDFEEGLHLYFEKKFTNAALSFEKVLANNPFDKTAKLYFDHAAHCMMNGVPDDWQGIETMDSK